MTREERILTKKKYGRKLKKDQVLKITAVTVMHETCIHVHLSLCKCLTRSMYNVEKPSVKPSLFINSKVNSLISKKKEKKKRFND